MSKSNPISSLLIIKPMPKAIEGFTTKPRHIAVEEAPKWVKEMEKQSNQPL